MAGVFIAVACAGNSREGNDDETGGGGGEATTGGEGTSGGSVATGGSSTGGVVGTGGSTGGTVSGGSTTGGRATGGGSVGGTGTGGAATGGSATGGGATAGSSGAGLGGLAGMSGGGNGPQWPPANCPNGACPTSGEVRPCNEALPFTVGQTMATTRVCCAGQWASACMGGMGGMSGMSGMGGMSGLGGGGVIECPVGCEAESSGLCGSERVTWVCTSTFDPNVFSDAGCNNPGTQVPRFCCSPTFKPECQ